MMTFVSKDNDEVLYEALEQIHPMYKDVLIFHMEPKTRLVPKDALSKKELKELYPLLRHKPNEPDPYPFVLEEAMNALRLQMLTIGFDPKRV